MQFVDLRTCVGGLTNSIRAKKAHFPRTRRSFLIIGRLRQNRISALASFGALSFRVLLLSSMYATASFCFRKFLEVFSIWITCCSTQQECGKNVVGRRPLFIPLQNSSKALSGPSSRRSFLALARVTITILGCVVEFSENTP